MSAAKRKVNPLTIQEKKAVILEVENSNGRTKSQIAEQFRIPKSTLSTILKEKERILELTDSEELGPQRKRVRMRRGAYPQLEEALFAWLQEQAAANQAVSGQTMLARSQELARQLGVDDFKTSSVWLDGFRKRHGLAAAGRPDSADGWRPETTPEGTVPLTQLPAMLDDYAATEVFVVAEMGLVFDLTPDEASVGACADAELAPRRFSVVVAASADGSQKLPLLIVGERSVSGASQPGRVAYHADPTAWIQPQHFSAWLGRRDGEMAAQGRKALFLCELSPAHAVGGGGREALQLACMPASPLTQEQLGADGVLHALKRQYRRRVTEFLVEHGRPPAAGEAVQMLSRAWWQDVSSAVVRRYHASVGLLRDEVNGQPAPPPAEGAAQLAALAGSQFAPSEGCTLESFTTADNALL
ncbi:Tigger transposable element-derived protein 4 [Amphibalanus amphitrite]|uniref:Tigger transposable element-derived protein 4 n=1 Tax=Amphibalanus amphitrite TaxID=1232801 RepID=A0A6A4VM76_AMPAM|nr:Tigger transposable element-derived protein 4 [Amphibalanus amphitrite]